MADARSDQTLVVGLGRFGRSLAETLTKLGQQVLGVDLDPRVVQECADELSYVVEADATDPEALRQLGAGDFGSAVVAIGNDVEASILVTYNLVEMGLPRVWGKAITSTHGDILRRVGAHRVIFPERDMGERVAHTMVGRTVDYVELDDAFVLIETTAPREAVGKTLAEAELRRRHHVTVVCVKRPGGRFSYATPETRIQVGDLLVVAGETARAEAFAALE